jgi:hypothetical protein
MFVAPLRQQLRRDAGDVVADVADRRLREPEREFSARGLAQERGLTRARIYQLLAEAAVVMKLRWPEGAELVQALREKALRTKPVGRGASLFANAADLFYPRRAATATPTGSASFRRQRAGSNDRDDSDGAAAA